VSDLPDRTTGLRAAWRQRRWPRAFRIAPPRWDAVVRAEVELLLARCTALAARTAEAEAAAQDTAASEPAATPPELRDKPLADAATALWRAQRRLAQETDARTQLSRQAGRHLRTCADALAEAGVMVQDHDGDPYHPGRSLEVLLFQDDPALTAETVIQTVRPSVYLRGRCVQLGQVIVGCPADTARSADPAEPTHAADSAQPADTPLTPAPARDEQVRNDHA
jgi:hypothetical protein